RRSSDLTDEDYLQFANWMKEKNYTYQSYLEYQLKQFEKEARKERYFDELKGQLDQIQKRIADSKKNEIMLYKDEIKMLLEQEIIARYYLQRGSVENGFKNDKDVRTAIDVLHDNARYKKILNIPG